jgi:hypothetical protein
MTEPHDYIRQRAAQLLGISYDEVTPEQRKWAKRATFIERYSAPIPKLDAPAVRVLRETWKRHWPQMRRHS